MEIWRDIKGYEGLYQVSNLGRIKSLARKDTLGRSIGEKLLKHNTNRKYIQVSLYRNGKQKLKNLHRILAEAFIPNPENKPQVNHKDGNKLNNSLSNLEWATISENIRHAFENGLNKVTQKHIESARKIGERSAKKVLQYNLTGDLIGIWDSMTEVERKLNIYHSAISLCCQGKRATAGGYRWEYMKDTQ